MRKNKSTKKISTKQKKQDGLGEGAAHDPDRYPATHRHNNMVQPLYTHQLIQHNHTKWTPYFIHTPYTLYTSRSRTRIHPSQGVACIQTEEVIPFIISIGEQTAKPQQSHSSICTRVGHPTNNPGPSRSTQSHPVTRPEKFT